MDKLWCDFSFVCGNGNYISDSSNEPKSEIISQIMEIVVQKPGLIALK